MSSLSQSSTSPLAPPAPITAGPTYAAPQALFSKKPVTSETSEWLERIDRLTPVITAHRAQTEREREMPTAVFTALHQAGISRMWVSREFGGGHVSIETGSAVIQRLAAIDASVAWQMGVQGAIGRLSDFLPEPTARKLFAACSGLVVGGVNPAGSATRVDGGFRITGTWAFASGSAHAEWLVCNAKVIQDGAPVMTATGPETRFVFVPKDQVRILDTWYTVGLRGTGSNDYAVDEVFVPEDFSVAGSTIFQPPVRPSRAFPVSYYDFGPFTSASTALGIARAALDELRRVATAKTPAGASKALGAGHIVQGEIGRAESLLRSAQLQLDDAAWHVQTFGETGGDPLSAMVRLTASTVAANAVAVVDTAYRLAGTSSLYETSPLERCFRDVHSATKHITLSHTHFEMVGQYLLGGALQMRR
jgi:indole-3-acetate monooxygenase